MADPEVERPSAETGRTREWTSRAAEALLLAAVVIAPWPYGAAGDVARYALAALVLGALGLWALGSDVRGRRPGLLVPAAGLPLVALAQAALGTSVTRVFTLEAALLLVAFLGAAVYWSEACRSRAAAWRLCAAVLAACAAQAAFGAAQWSLAPDRIYGRAAPLVTTPFGSYVNHNHFAGLVAMGALLAASVAWGLARRAGALTPGAIASGGLGLGLVAAQLASRSRGGLLALACGAVALVLLRARANAHHAERAHLRWIAPALAAAGALALGLGVVPAETRAHLLSVLGGASDDSGVYRLDVAAGTLRLAARHPLMGCGLGAFADAFPEVKRGHGAVRSTHAESDALEFLAEAGLFGLVLAFALGRAAWRRLRERLDGGHDALHKSLAEGAAAALAALAAHSWVDFNLRLPANALVAASLLGLAACARRQEPRPPHESRPASGAWRAAACAALLLLALGAGWRAAGAWALDAALAHPTPERRVAALDRVLAGHPYLDRAWRERGRAWRDLSSGELGPARLARAERDFVAASRLRPAWGEAWADLGWTRLLRGDTHGARAALDEGVRVDPTHPGVGLTRAEALARLRDLPEAMAQLGRTLDSNPQLAADWVAGLGTAWSRDPHAFAPFARGDARRESTVAEALRKAAGH